VLGTAILAKNMQEVVPVKPSKRLHRPISGINSDNDHNIPEVVTMTVIKCKQLISPDGKPNWNV
jgi:hypothetical protein